MSEGSVFDPLEMLRKLGEEIDGLDEKAQPGYRAMFKDLQLQWDCYNKLMSMWAATVSRVLTSVENVKKSDKSIIIPGARLPKI